MSLFSQPTPPSPTAGLGAAQQAGQQQQGFNVATQAGSMVNQNNPFGSLTYTQTGTGPGGVPLYSANQTLSSPEQALLNQQQGEQYLFGSGATGLLGGANYGASNPTSDILGLTGNISSGILGNEVNYLNPYFNMQTNQQETQLLNQGFSPGNTPGSQGSAWSNAMMPLQQAQDLTVSNFLANAEPQAFSQAQGLYTLPAALASSMYNPSMAQLPSSQLTQTPQLGNVNEIGAYSTAQQAVDQQYQAQQAQYNAMMQGMFGLGSSALGLMAAPFTGGMSLLAPMAMSGLNSGGGYTSGPGINTGYSVYNNGSPVGIMGVGPYAA